MPKLRVLVIEDDRDIIALVHSVLGDTYECYSAENGLEGLQRALLGEPDLVICDIMMPVMDGRGFISKLRGFPGFAETPVIFLSALGSRQQIKEGYELGAALYLSKPIDPKRLRRNVELFIEDHDVKYREKKMSINEVMHYHSQSESDAKSPPQASVQEQVIKPDRKVVPDSSSSKSHKDDRIRVLLVEDDKDAMKMMRVGLGDGYEVLEAVDGINAIEKAVRYKPDLFIIDGMLPKMTGYQLIMMLKKNRHFYKSPIIFISGKATDRDEQYVKKLGISCFLPKPFTVKDMLVEVEKIVKAPGFAIRGDRISARQAHLEKFQAIEMTRKTTEKQTDPIEDMEKRRLEEKLKKQLK